MSRCWGSRNLWREVKCWYRVIRETAFYNLPLADPRNTNNWHNSMIFFFKSDVWTFCYFNFSDTAGGKILVFQGCPKIVLWLHSGMEYLLGKNKSKKREKEWKICSLKSLMERLELYVITGIKMIACTSSAIKFKKCAFSFRKIYQCSVSCLIIDSNFECQLNVYNNPNIFSSVKMSQTVV